MNSYFLNEKFSNSHTFRGTKSHSTELNTNFSCKTYYNKIKKELTLLLTLCLVERTEKISNQLLQEINKFNQLTEL